MTVNYIITIYPSIQSHGTVYRESGTQNMPFLRTFHDGNFFLLYRVYMYMCGNGQHQG